MPKDPQKVVKDMAAALAEFADAIDATGGTTKDNKGYVVPVADEDWIDLGAAYVTACRVLGRKVKVEE